MNNFSLARAEFSGVVPPRKGREGTEVCSGQYKKKSCFSLWKRVGDSVLYAWGKAVYWQWGLGTDYYCAMGSVACESLGKETRTAQWVLAERTMRTHRMWCWTFRVSPAGLGHQHLLRDQSAPRVQRDHPPQKHFILVILCHLSLAYTFPPSLISLVPSCLNTSMWHTVLILLTAADTLSLDMQAVLAVQLLETAGFSLDECRWTLITLLNCECRCCKIPVWCAVTRYVNSAWFLRKKWKCDNVLSKCLSVTI